MPDQDESREKLLGAFQGFIRSYKLEPLKSRGIDPSSEFFPVFRYIESKDQTLELQYRREEHDRLLRFVDIYIPGKIDRKISSGLLVDELTEWVDQSKDVNNIEQVKKALDTFLLRLEENIDEFKVFIPIEGLNIEGISDFELGRLRVYRNTTSNIVGELLRTLKLRHQTEEDNIYSVFTNAPCFFVVEYKGHAARAIEESIDICFEALSILRLFLSSYYLDIYRRQAVPLRMSISGTTASIDRSNSLYVKSSLPIDQQIPGTSMQFIHYESYKLNKEKLEFMQKIGIQLINSKFQSSGQSVSMSIPRRLNRSISWFSKGTTALSLAESFLFYAIAVESLFSEGRTSQETYSLWISTLVTRDELVNIFPISGFISTDFGRELDEAPSISDRFEIINRRANTLFDYRNQIAHGSVFHDEIAIVNLMDFETIIRNAILSFVIDEWESLGVFTDWVNRSVGLSYHPLAR